MGKVPVAPNNLIIGSEGDRKVSGFGDRAVDLGSNKIERMNHAYPVVAHPSLFR